MEESVSEKTVLKIFVGNYKVPIWSQFFLPLLSKKFARNYLALSIYFFFT